MARDSAWEDRLLRRVYGFLILALVVLLGVLFVETDPRAAATSGPRDSSYRVVLGGRSPASPIDAPYASRAEELENELGDEADPSDGPSVDPAGAGSERLPPPPAEFTHTVRTGEVLGSILIAYLGSASNDRMTRVCRRNHLADANQIRRGDVLHIPVVEPVPHTATGEETLRDIARQHFGSPERVEALLRANPALPPESATRPLRRGLVLWVPR